jgi:hypothetical protein
MSKDGLAEKAEGICGGFFLTLSASQPTHSGQQYRCSSIRSRCLRSSLLIRLILRITGVFEIEVPKTALEGKVNDNNRLGDSFTLKAEEGDVRIVRTIR